MSSRARRHWSDGEEQSRRAGRRQCRSQNRLRTSPSYRPSAFRGPCLSPLARNDEVWDRAAIPACERQRRCPPGAVIAISTDQQHGMRKKEDFADLQLQSVGRGLPAGLLVSTGAAPRDQSQLANPFSTALRRLKYRKIGTPAATRAMPASARAGAVIRVLSIKPALTTRKAAGTSGYPGTR